MFKVPRSLVLALCAGLLAVAAASSPRVVAGAQQQIQFTSTTHVDMPGIFRLFGAGKAESTTTTVSDTRQRTDNSNGTSDIVQCDLKRLIHLDNNAKTYYAVTFAQAEAAMAAAMRRMSHYTPPPQRGRAATAPPIQGSGGFTLSVNTVNDPQTQTIFGMTAHHVIETITGTANGTGQCPNGTMTMTNDEWYVTKVVSLQCPLPRPPVSVMPAMPAGAPGGGARNPCFGQFQTQAQGKAASGNRFALKQTMSLDMGGFKLTTHNDITQYQVMPYNPSFFDVPAGYTLVQPPTAL